jgi:dephospho-CoA kinase
MLRVGLTGSLGSGKSTVAAMLRELGAHVIEADELGRKLMEPGQAVFDEIVRVFGPEIVGADGRLNRPALAALAFQGGRLDELNAIIHPAVIDEQRRWTDALFAQDPYAVAVVESALIFEVERDARVRGSHPLSEKPVPEKTAREKIAPWMGHAASDELLLDWRNRFNRIIVLIAPDDVKVQRYVNRICPAESCDEARRASAEADARIRLAKQIPDAEKAARADFVIENVGRLDQLRQQVEIIWQSLRAESNKRAHSGSLE